MQKSELLPLNLIDEYIAEIDIFISELEVSIKFEKTKPELPDKYDLVIEFSGTVALKSLNEALSLTEEKNENDRQVITKSISKLNQELKISSEKLNKIRIGFFSRGRLRKKISQLTSELAEAQRSQHMINMLIQLQQILHHPFSLQYIPQTITTSYSKEERLNGLDETRRRVKLLTDLKNQKKEIFSENVDYLDSLIDAHIDLEKRLVKALNENNENYNLTSYYD